MQSLLDCAQGITPFERVPGWFKRFLIRYTKRDASLQRHRVPPRNEGRKHCLVATWRYSEEIDHWYSVLECLAKPSVVGGVWVLAHEGVVDRLVAFENLPMHLALLVIPDLAARLWENSFDRQKE